jgi:AraC-like DNA-binding protein
MTESTADSNCLEKAAAREEVLGRALAWHLLFGLSLTAGILITAFDTARSSASSSLCRRRLSAPQLVIRHRVHAAADMMRRTDLPLTEISRGTGFSDQSHFTRTFVREMGETTSRFRRRYR